MSERAIFLKREEKTLVFFLYWTSIHRAAVFFEFAIDKDWQAGSKHKTWWNGNKIDMKAMFLKRRIIGVKNKCQVIMSHIKLKLLVEVQALCNN